MGVFLQNLDMSVEQSMVDPGSPFYEEWQSNFLDPSSIRCKYYKGTLTMEDLQKNSAYSNNATYFDICDRDDFFRRYLPTIQNIYAPDLCLGVVYNNPINGHDIIVDSCQLIMKTNGGIIQNVIFNSGSDSSFVVLRGANRVIDCHLNSREILIEVSKSDSDIWRGHVPEFINSTVNKNAEIVLEGFDGNLVYDEVWLWINWKRMGLDRRPNHYNSSGPGSVYKDFVEQLWNVFPLYSDVNISELLPLPEELLHKDQYVIRGGALTSNIKIAKLDSINFEQEVYASSLLKLKEPFVSQDGYVLMM